jgi:ribokinase
MGENGSVLVCDGAPPIFQPAILAPVVVDTTGAGDTFTAAYTVALIERQAPADALRFAGKFLQCFQKSLLIYERCEDL